MCIDVLNWSGQAWKPCQVGAIFSSSRRREKPENRSESCRGAIRVLCNDIVDFLLNAPQTVKSKLESGDKKVTVHISRACLCLPEDIKLELNNLAQTASLNLVSALWTQVAGGGLQVHAINERLTTQQRLLAGVQLLCFLQPVAPGGGHLDPVGTHRQRVGRVETQEGQTPEGVFSEAHAYMDTIPNWPACILLCCDYS